MSKNLRTGTAEYYVDPTTDGYPDDKVPLPLATVGQPVLDQAIQGCHRMCAE